MEFSNAVVPSNVDFQATCSAEKHGNQAKENLLKSGDSLMRLNTDSKRFVLKAKALERLGAFVCRKKFAYCGRVPRLSSFHNSFLQVRSVGS